MPTHKEIRVVPHSPRQLYELVADIERYPEFLPWCIAARNRSREAAADGELITADLVIGFKMFRERVTSKVTLHPPGADETGGRIDVEYVQGPLKYLQPTLKHAPIDRFVTPDEFEGYAALARGKGFLLVSATPLTRSSYHAGDDFAKLRAARDAKLATTAAE